MESVSPASSDLPGGLMLRQTSVHQGTFVSPGSNSSSASLKTKIASERRKSRQGVLNFKEKFKAKIKLLPQFTIKDTRVVNDPDDQVECSVPRVALITRLIRYRGVIRNLCLRRLTFL
jgi:hypothetical protein